MNTPYQPENPTLQDELLALLARQSKRVPVTVLLVSIIVGALAAGHLPPVVWITWMALVALMQLVRILVLTRLPRMSHWTHAKRLRIAAMLSLVNGIVHASSFAAFPFLPDFERAVLTMLMAGLAAGTVATTAGYRPIYLCHVIPIMAPMFVLWAIMPAGADFAWANFAVAIVVLLFAGILFSVASDSYKMFVESYEIRTQQFELNQQLRAALAKADAANKSKTRFLASASHDLRQPLHTLSLYSAALTSRPLDSRSRAIAEQMSTAMKSLASQLDALLDISRLDAGVVKPRLSPVFLRPLLRRLCDEFAPSAVEKDLTIQLECSEDVVVQSDETLLETIIINLLSNAIKYTDQGSVSIFARRTENNIIQLEVRDTGRGIEVDQQERVFEEFFQVSNPHRDRAQGFGLGLSIVQRMVYLLGIRMEMDSELEHGTCFTLFLAATTARPALKADSPKVSRALKGLRILAVDDESEVRDGMRVLLEGDGCVVDVAASTVEAISAASLKRPDILLFDFRLRDHDDGLKTLAEIRKLYPDLPAIMVSGDTAPDRLREANAAGVGLLHKPVSGDVLKAAIAAACADYDLYG